MKKSNANDARIVKISRTMKTPFAVGKPDGPDNIIHRSKGSGVVGKVHQICDRVSAKGGSRADIIAACTKLGIALHTIRTQYERWRNPPAKKSKKAA